MPKTRSEIAKSSICNDLQNKSVVSLKLNSPKHKNLFLKNKTVLTTPDKTIPKKRKPMVVTTSPRKTRGLCKKEDDMECEACGSLEPLSLLQNCPNCMSLFHMSCIGLEPTAILFIQKNSGNWSCPRCICCSKCDEYIYDPSNLQCANCARAFHGFCRPKKSSLPVYPYKSWYCDKCEELKLTKKSFTVSTSPKNIKKTLVKSISCKENVFKNQKCLSKNKSEIKIKENLIENVNSGVGDNYLNAIINLTPHKMFNKLEKSNIFHKSALLKTEILNENKSNNNLKLQKINVKNRWIYFGQFLRFKPVYESSYSDNIASVSNVYICEFCFRSLSDLCLFHNHLRFCPWKHPPGNEIYCDGELNIWEVEGNLQTTYCRNLCLLAKFFLSSKTLYHEVETFKFYILTEHTSRGCILAGYFSKEKNPSKNNNLSCLLTLPSHQSKGYGKMLIDLSYYLSMREHKIGSPEHPLSDMGLIAYRSYWKSVIISSLRKRRNQHSVSIKDLSIETAIHSCDIISTLLSLGMIIFHNEYFYIDTNIAFNASLNSFRRRTIDSNLLIWQPCFDVFPNNKMNSYVTD